MSQIDLMHAECVAAMRKLAARSVDHTITDPPYSKQQPLFTPKAAQATQLQLGG
jgi:DNA modification methylase